MLKIGSIILSISEGLQFVVSVLMLLISLIGQHAPILKMVFTDEEIVSLDSKVIATTKSLAIMHNSGAVIFTFFSLIIIWTSLIHGHKWAFWTLLATGVFGHIMWFLSDRVIGNKTFIVNTVFLTMFLIGIGLSGYELLRQ